MTDQLSQPASCRFHLHAPWFSRSESFFISARLLLLLEKGFDENTVTRPSSKSKTMSLKRQKNKLCDA